MKVKGISIWEQHLEKIIIGIALLIFVGFTAMQFIGEPNAVEVGGETFTPGDVDSTLEDKALTLQGPLSDEARSPMDFATVARQHEAIKSTLESPIVPRPELPNVIAGVMPTLEGSIAAGTLVNVPQIPTPVDLRRERYFDSVVDEFVSAEPTVQALFQGAPYDLQFVTVGADVLLGEIRERFLASGPNGEAPVPMHWHNNQVHILDVYLERQELIDDEWTEPQVIDPIPTQFTYRDLITDGAIDRPFADRIVAQLVDDPNAQIAIMQPSFFPLENSRWSPPVAQAEMPEDMGDEEDPILREIRAKERKLDDLRRRADTIFRNLERLGGPLDDEPADTGSGGSRGGDNNSDEFAGGGGPGGLRDPNAGANEANAARRRNMTRAWKNFLDQIRKLEDDLEALGVNIVRVEEEPEFDAAAELQKDVVDVWAHDLSVVADRTYRYRLRVDIANPFFGRKLNLKEEQHPVADDFTMKSEWSEWSNPIQIQRPLEVFVTNANTGGGPLGGSTSARVEVYRFYDGRWWKENFNVSPGQRIGATKQVRIADAQPGDPPLEIDFTTSWFVLDVVPGIGADSGPGRRGLDTAVYLQSLTSPADYVVRIPSDDRTNPDREDLEAEADSLDRVVTIR